MKRDLSIYGFLAFLVLFLLTSCQKDPIRETPVDPPDPIPPASYTNGTFIINEGNFNWANASITYINDSDRTVFQDIFRTVNGRSLGDVAQSMQVFNNRGFILVNNSNTVEVVSMDDFSSVNTISGFHSPRYIEFIDSSKAYVSNLLRDISVVDLQSMTIKKSIPVSSWTEGFVKYGNQVFVTSIGNYNEPSSQRDANVLVIDAKSDEIVDSIKTGVEPLGIVMDLKEKIWVLCTGGYDNFEEPTLIRINPELRTVEKVFPFPDAKETPSRLCINATRDTIYFLKGGVYRMSVNALEIPAQPLIPSNGRVFYGLGIDPANGQIYVSDAVDFVQSGYVYRFRSTDGVQLERFEAGRIPGSFCFYRMQGK